MLAGLMTSNRAADDRCSTANDDRSLTKLSRPECSNGWSLIVVMLLAMVSNSSGAIVSSCVEPDCNPDQGGGRYGKVAAFRLEPGAGSWSQRFFDVKSDGQPAPKLATGSAGSQTLHGQLAGQWDQVAGFVTFPITTDEVTDHLLLRGLPAVRSDSGDTYRVTGWTRSAYWFDVGNGIPRLLASELIEPNYIPQPGDPFVDAGHLNYAQLVQYREQGRDYSEFPMGGAFGSLFFVADPMTGEVLDIIIDLYDANGNYEKTEFLFVGDALLPLIISYELSEPDALYYTTYGDYITLNEDVGFGLANHIPGVDFTDPDVFSAGLDAENVPLNLLLEGYRDMPVDGVQWTYSELTPLGYTWGEAREIIFSSTFEDGIEGGSAKSMRSLIRSHKE